MGVHVRLRRQSPFNLLLALSASLANADLPYNPTQLFLSSASGETGRKILYQLDPPSSSASNGRLRSISLDSDLNPSSLPYDTITASLPFLQPDQSTAILSSQDPNGTISVYTGDCSADLQTAQLWRFTPNNSSSTGQGTWILQTLSSSGAQGQAAPNYLASSIAFSPTTLEADASIYAFGGMCPNQPSSSDATWTTNANYSNQLIQLTPGSSPESYVRQVLKGQSQPIAEAGFSITPLSPAFSNSSNGVLSQQQNFLLLGGHTQAAFINVSHVALFSLPEATWTFLPIYDAPAKPDLLRRDSIPDIEPRSGHTAVLSSDGTKVIILGGWVGNVTTAAIPQLAVLEIGAGYGGSAPSWTWTDTSSQQTPFDDGSGVYGHGAVLLPGNVVMATGGYSISAPSTSVKRDAQTTTWFYNITSGTFLTSYSPISDQPSSVPTAEKSVGPLTTTSQKAGLGVGLTLGLLAIGLACLFGWMYWRKLKRQHAYQKQFTVRQDYRDTSDGHASVTQQPDYTLGEYIDEKHSNGLWNGNSVGARNSHSVSQEHAQSAWSSLREAERSGLDLDIPSPHRGLRKNRSMLTSSTTNFVDPRMNRNSGAISPIDELPEHERSSNENDRDPFRDPSPEPLHMDGNVTSWRSEPAASGEGLKLTMPYPPAATAQEERQRQMPTWIRDWGASDMVPRQGSPDKSDRTSSTLSEQSQRPTSSWRSSDYLQYLPHVLNPFADPRRSLSPSPDHSDGHDQAQDAFYTAQTSLHDLPATNQSSSGLAVEDGIESETLLGTPTSVRNSQRHSHSQSMALPISPDTEPTFTYPTAAYSPTHPSYGSSRAPRRGASSSRIGSWVGSVRRTLANPTASYHRSSSISSISAANYMSNNYHNPTGGLVDADQYTDTGSASSSPTKLSGPRNPIKRKPVSFSGPPLKLEPKRVVNDAAQGSPVQHTRPEDGTHNESDVLQPDDSGNRAGGSSLVEASTLPASEPAQSDDTPRRSNAVEEIVQRRVLLSLPGTRLRVVNPGAEDTDGRSDTGSSVDVAATDTSNQKQLNKVAQQVQKIEEDRRKSALASGNISKTLVAGAEQSP